MAVVNEPIAEHGEQSLHSRPIQRVAAAMSPQQPAVYIQEKVAAELECVFPFRDAPDFCPAGDEFQIAPDDARPHDADQGCPLKTECGISGSVGIGQDREVRTAATRR